ncbi:MAG: MBL fold metallo-hydrolase [Methanobrevibacter sp.]|nr:MBL fold metallo-hydrolase [Methanobrevibacter sp.]
MVNQEKTKIIAVKTYENGFMVQPFAFGGEEGMENFDPSIKYRASLQNYLIDTGDEVILVDTDMPKEFPDMEVEEDTMIHNGARITDYVSALNELGYKCEDVSKILITHKHPDHTGELRNFPNAKVYMSKREAEDLGSDADNIIPVEYASGSYYNFEKSEKIADGIYLIEAIGHTNGNSIVIAEDDGLFYMIHGDITYTDEALYANKLSIIFEDLPKARETLDNVREFISNNPTVYLSTHTPYGPENIENKKIVDLNNPPEPIYFE